MGEADKFFLRDKYLSSLVKKYGPCEIKKRPKDKYFVSLVRSIVGQQLSVKAAATIYGRLESKAGKVSAERLLEMSSEEITSCGVSRAKASYIQDLALKTQNGELKLGKIDKMSDEEAEDELVAVKGIGKWTAEMFLMFSLGRPDIFPVDDMGIRNGMKKLLGREMQPKQMEQFAARHWRPYRTCASWYIWQSLDNQPV